MDCFTLFLSPFVNHSQSLCSAVSFRVMFFVVVISGAIRLNPPSSSQLTVFVAGKLFFLVYRIVIPCLFLPVWRVVSSVNTTFLVKSYGSRVLTVQRVLPSPPYKLSHLTTTCKYVNATTRATMFNLQPCEHTDWRLICKKKRC